MQYRVLKFDMVIAYGFETFIEAALFAKRHTNGVGVTFDRVSL